MLIRKPHVAGSFYPADPSELREFCETHLKSQKPGSLSKARAVILPHAGYVYSGQTACEVLSRVKIPDTVFLIGPNHWSSGAAFALYAQGEWQTPLGSSPIAGDLSASLIESSTDLRRDANAHSNEHSLEVILPFLQYKNPSVRISPLIVGTLDFDKAAEAAADIAPVLSERPDVMVIVSTDMNHYESDEVTRKKDRYALDAILALDDEALLKAVLKHNISMCGVVPVYMLLCMKDALGIQKAELVKYATSAEAGGDKSRVVGYAGFIFK